MNADDLNDLNSSIRHHQIVAAIKVWAQTKNWSQDAWKKTQWFDNYYEFFKTLVRSDR